jgi:hypothetical protein
VPGLGRCFYCICKVCNRLKCPHFYFYKTSFERCIFCLQRFEVPTTECDFFRSKYKKQRVYHIKKRGKTHIERVEDKLDRILECMKKEP